MEICLFSWGRSQVEGEEESCGCDSEEWWPLAFWPSGSRSEEAQDTSPDGWELIQPPLDELDQKIEETEPHEGKRKVVECLWPIFRIHHQKTSHTFDLFDKRKAISRELEYCIKEGYAENLIAKWQKQGCGNLCCLRCSQTRDTNFGTNCICRVPKSKLEAGRIIEHTHCGCRGCSG
ncbi:LOW QUALITY PROTEIN: protein BUD31 homolog [Acridotheres tristis]